MNQMNSITESQAVKKQKNPFIYSKATTTIHNLNALMNRSLTIFTVILCVIMF